MSCVRRPDRESGDAMYALLDTQLGARRSQGGAVREPAQPKALRITGQARTTRGFAYDLAIDERRLTITIEETSDVGRWHVNVKARDRLRGAEQSHSADAITRADALRAVTDRWDTLDGARIDFDWPTVVGLLAEVRAL
jgi:hypothetical protein